MKCEEPSQEHIYLPNDVHFPPKLSSATEAEIGALYIHVREALYIRKILLEFGHLQKQMSIQTNSLIATGVINHNLQPKCTKAMSMHFHFSGIGMLRSSSDFSHSQAWWFMWIIGWSTIQVHITKLWIIIPLHHLRSFRAQKDVPIVDRCSSKGVLNMGLAVWRPGAQATAIDTRMH